MNIEVNHDMVHVQRIHSVREQFVHLCVCLCVRAPLKCVCNENDRIKVKVKE